MKTLILALGILLSVNSFATVGIPNLNCVGTVGDASVPLQYRDGAAAFMNVYAAEFNEYGFLVVLNKANPIKDNESLPVTMIIGNYELGKTYIEKKASMRVDSKALKIITKLEDGKTATLSCFRLLTK